MQLYKTLADMTEEYLSSHPEMLDDYVYQVFDGYIRTGNGIALLSALRIVNRIRKVEFITQNIKDNEADFNTFVSILHIMGYRVTLAKI